jgi:dihydrofolate reductase
VRIEGYAIVSADGMIADHNRHMPAGLKIEADVRLFNEGLDSAALIVHGRHSHEQQGPRSNRRRRLILTDRCDPITDHPQIPNASLWNPSRMPFDDALMAMGITAGKVAVTGGSHVFGLFLGIGFDAFHLSRAGKVRLPGGRPVFPQVPERTPAQVLRDHGLVPGAVEMLDQAADVTLVTWSRS